MSHRSKLFYEKLTNTSKKPTATDQKIIDYLLRSYPSGMLKNASEIAQEIDVNTSTVTRYFQKIGYKSIKEAQNEFKKDIDFLISSPSDRYQLDQHIDFLQETLDNDYENIKNTFSGVTFEKIEKFFKLTMQQSGNVFIMGDRSKAFALSHYLYAQLKFMTSKVHLLDSEKFILADALSNIKDEDTLILFSVRRYLTLYEQVADLFKKYDGNIIVFSDSHLSPIIKYADIHFLIETKCASPFDSYTAGFSLINALLGELIKKEEKYFIKKYKNTDEIYSQLELFS